MYKWIRKRVKSYFGLYDIDDLDIGGHCGCCGKWIPNAIVPIMWKVTLCNNCISKNIKN